VYVANDYDSGIDPVIGLRLAFNAGDQATSAAKGPARFRGQKELEWAIRAQANFSEYVPITLILFACAEYNKTDWRVLSIFAATLILGRLMHSYGFLFARERLEFRVRGMMLTFWTMIALSIWNVGFLSFQVLSR